MPALQTAFRYALREDVVIDLTGLRAFDLERQVDVPATCLPAWTIGTVTTQFDLDRRPAYLVEFSRHGHPCIAVVDERSIEGVA